MPLAVSLSILPKKTLTSPSLQNTWLSAQHCRVQVPWGNFLLLGSALLWIPLLFHCLQKKKEGISKTVLVLMMKMEVRNPGECGELVLLCQCLSPLPAAFFLPGINSSLIIRGNLSDRNRHDRVQIGRTWSQKAIQRRSCARRALWYLTQLQEPSWCERESKRPCLTTYAMKVLAHGQLLHEREVQGMGHPMIRGLQSMCRQHRGQYLPWSNAELWNGLCEVWMGDWQTPKEEEKDSSFLWSPQAPVIHM